MDKCFYCKKEEPVLLVEKLPTGTLRVVCPTCFSFMQGFNSGRLNKLRLIPPLRQKPDLILIKNVGDSNDKRN